MSLFLPENIFQSPICQAAFAVAAVFYGLSWLLFFYRHVLLMVVLLVLSFCLLLLPAVLYPGLWMILYISVVAWVYHRLYKFQTDWYLRIGIREELEKAWMLILGRHEVQAADPSDFPRLDLDYYDRMAVEMKALGFDEPTDLEWLTLTRSNPAMRTFVRSFTRSDGRISGGVNQLRFVRPRDGFERSFDQRSISLETEFSDETSLESTTMPGGPETVIGPTTVRNYIPETTPEELLLYHENSIREYKERHGVKVVPRLTEAEEFESSRRRMRAIRRMKLDEIGIREDDLASPIFLPETDEARAALKAWHRLREAGWLDDERS